MLVSVLFWFVHIIHGLEVFWHWVLLHCIPIKLIVRGYKSGGTFNHLNWIAWNSYVHITSAQFAHSRIDPLVQLFCLCFSLLWVPLDICYELVNEGLDFLYLPRLVVNKCRKPHNIVQTTKRKVSNARRGETMPSSKFSRKMSRLRHTWFHPRKINPNMWRIGILVRGGWYYDKVAYDHWYATCLRMWCILRGSSNLALMKLYSN